MAMNNSSAGYCPCCSKPITEYRLLPEENACEYLPCKCRSLTWTVQKFLGGSSIHRRTRQPYWDAAKEAVNRILSKTDASNDPICLPPGLQSIILTIEDAETIRKLLDDPNLPTYAGKDLPKVDASVLLKKIYQDARTVAAAFLEAIQW